MFLKGGPLNPQEGDLLMQFQKVFFDWLHVSLLFVGTEYTMSLCKLMFRFK